MPSAAITQLKSNLFEVRARGVSQPPVREGVFVKVGCRAERFWGKVMSADRDGTLRIVVDNDLLRSPWQRGHELVIQHEHVLESMDAADGLTFDGLAAALGSPQGAALAWQIARVESGKSRPSQNTLYVVPT